MSISSGQHQLIESCAEKDSKVTSVFNGKEWQMDHECSPWAQKEWQLHTRYMPSLDKRPDEAVRGECQKDRRMWAEREMLELEVSKLDFSLEMSRPRAWPWEGLAE